MATHDQNVGQELKDRMDIVINNWEQLFGYVEKYQHSGEISRNRKEYQKGLEVMIMTLIMKIMMMMIIMIMMIIMMMIMIRIMMILMIIKMIIMIMIRSWTPG